MCFLVNGPRRAIGDLGRVCAAPLSPRAPQPPLAPLGERRPGRRRLRTLLARSPAAANSVCPGRRGPNSAPRTLRAVRGRGRRVRGRKSGWAGRGGGRGCGAAEAPGRGPQGHRAAACVGSLVRAVRGGRRATQGASRSPSLLFRTARHERLYGVPATSTVANRYHEGRSGAGEWRAGLLPNQ